MQTSLLRHRVSHDAEDADGSKDDAGAEARAGIGIAHTQQQGHIPARPVRLSRILVCLLIAVASPFRV
jgi:hypothetical protein